MNLRWLPNAITLTRMAISMPLLWLLSTGRYSAALWLALAAGVSDALDGFLAKRFGWHSALGAVLDPIADKLLLIACLLGLWWGQQLPFWLLALVFGRDLVVGAGALVYWRVVGPFTPMPSLLSKMTTMMQIVLVVGLLVHRALRTLPLSLLEGWMLATALLTVASGLDYVVRYSMRASRALRSKP